MRFEEGMRVKMREGAKESGRCPTGFGTIFGVHSLKSEDFTVYYIAWDDEHDYMHMGDGNIEYLHGWNVEGRKLRLALMENV